MLVTMLLYAAALVLGGYIRSSAAQEIFHGTSIIITANDLEPRNATLESASFYCFATPRGYISFGWWTGGDPEDVDLAPVSPEPRLEEIDWFEYSTGACNSHGKCELKAYNFNGSNPETPAFIEDYIILPFQLGKSEQELMFLSYFDREHGKIAVGVREVLLGSECRRVHTTLEAIIKQQRLPIEFDLEDPCGAALQDVARSSKQAVFKLHSKALELARLRPSAL